MAMVAANMDYKYPSVLHCSSVAPGLDSIANWFQGTWPFSKRTNPKPHLFPALTDDKTI